MKVKYHGFRYIVDRLREAGAINSISREGGVQTLKDWIKHGYIKFRKKPPGMRNMASDLEIQEIITAFSPGGDGWWEPGKKYPKTSVQVTEQEPELEGQDTGGVTEAADAYVATGDTFYPGITSFGAKSDEGSPAQ